MSRPTRPTVRSLYTPGVISIGYVLVLIIWLLFMDIGAPMLGVTPIGSNFHPYSDIIFIVVSGMVLFGLISKSQDTIEESEQRLSTLVANLPGIVYRCRNQRGWPMEIVQGDCENLVGYRAGALESNDVSWGQDVIHPEDREQVWDSVQAGIEAGDSYEISYRVRTADGDVRWVWEQGRAVEPVGESVLKLEGYISDITSRKERETELERAKSIIESTDDVVFVVDEHYTLEFVNRAIRSYLDVPPESLRGESIHDLATELMAEETDVEKFERTLQTMMENDEGEEGPVLLEVELDLDVGQVFGEFHFSSFDVNGTRKVAIISRDITDQKLRVRQIEVLDRILRHNVRNELNVIRGYGETIAGDVSGAVKEQAARIVDFSDSLLKTTEKERKVTRILSENPGQRPVKIGKRTRSLVNEFQSRYPDAAIEEDIEEPAFGAATEYLGWAVGELLENAIEHSDRSTPSVTVEVHTKGEHVTLAVTDDAPRISEMDLKILDGHEELTPLYHGTGLGLWLVYVIVQQSSASIDVEQFESGGKRIAITFQRADPWQEVLA